MNGRPIRIACFGDSLTEGYGLSRGEALPTVLERLLDEEGIQSQCLNYGISGETFEDGLRRIDQVIEAAPDAVILEFGANDFFLEEPVDTIQTNCRAVIEQLRAHDLPILLVGITALPFVDEGYKRDFDAIFPAVAEEYGLPLYSDILASYFGNSMLMLLDGTHPNAQGVEAIARDMLPSVMALVTKAQKRD